MNVHYDTFVNTHTGVYAINMAAYRLLNDAKIQLKHGGFCIALKFNLETRSHVVDHRVQKFQPNK